jgi:K319-like protein
MQQPTSINKQQPQVISIQNHPPKANAGSDVKVKEGANVVLNAKKSSDLDAGDKLSYQWKQVGGQPIVTIQNTNQSAASFAAPNVDKTTTLTFLVAVSDDKGGQSTDTVKVSVKNIDVPAITTTTGKDTTAKTDVIPQQDDKSINPIKSTTTTSDGLDNTTAKALSNVQNALKNNNNNLSKTTTPTTPTVTSPNNQLSASSVFTAQGIGSTVAVQSNSLVSSRAAYDVIFKTASTGVIGKMEMTFPAGTHVASPILVEVSGLGPGSLSVSGQTLTYTVTSPVSVPAGVYLRLEIWRISNPAIPSSSLQVQIATKTSGGSTIDTGSSTIYFVRQIATGDISDNAITSAKIGDGQVKTNDIAPFGVQTGNLGAQALTSDNLADFAVQTDKVANGAITSEKIEAGVILPHVTKVVGTFQSVTPGTYNYATATCHPGDRATSGGYFIGSFDSTLRITESEADSSDDPTTWVVRAFNPDQQPQPIQAIVMCISPAP